MGSQPSEFSAAGEQTSTDQLATAPPPNATHLHRYKQHSRPPSPRQHQQLPTSQKPQQLPRSLPSQAMMAAHQSLTTPPNTQQMATLGQHSSTAFQPQRQSLSLASHAGPRINSASLKSPPKEPALTRPRSPTSFPQSHLKHQPTSPSPPKPPPHSPSHGLHPTTADNP